MLAALAKRALRPLAAGGAATRAGRLYGVQACSRLLRGGLAGTAPSGAASPGSSGAPDLPPWAASVLESQLRFLEGLAGDGPKAIAAAERSLRALCLHWPEAAAWRSSLLAALVGLVTDPSLTGPAAAATLGTSSAGAGGSAFMGLAAVTRLLTSLPAKVAAGIGAASPALFGDGGGGAAGWRGKVLAAYLTTVLSADALALVDSSGGRSGDAVAQGFVPLLGSLTQAELEASVLPAVEKLLLKCPEAAAPALASLFQALPPQLDLAPAVRAHGASGGGGGGKERVRLGPLLRLARSLKPEAREPALATLAALAMRCTGGARIACAAGGDDDGAAGAHSALLVIACEAAGCLESGEGLVQWTQRHALLRALRCCCGAAATAAAAAAAATVGAGHGDAAGDAALLALCQRSVACLELSLDKESHAETRAFALASLGEWIELAHFALGGGGGSGSNGGASAAVAELGRRLVVRAKADKYCLGAAAGLAEASGAGCGGSFLARASTGGGLEGFGFGASGGIVVGSGLGATLPLADLETLLFELGHVLAAALKRPKAAAQHDAVACLGALLAVTSSAKAATAADAAARASLAAKALDPGGGHPAGLAVAALLGGGGPARSSPTFLFAPALFATDGSGLGLAPPPELRGSLRAGAARCVLADAGFPVATSGGSTSTSSSGGGVPCGVEPWPQLVALCASLALAALPSARGGLGLGAALFPSAAEAGARGFAAARKGGLRGSCPAAAALALCLLHPGAAVRRAASSTVAIIVGTACDGGGGEASGARAALAWALYDLAAFRSSGAQASGADSDKRRAALASEIAAWDGGGGGAGVAAGGVEGERSATSGRLGGGGGGGGDQLGSLVASYAGAALRLLGLQVAPSPAASGGAGAAAALAASELRASLPPLALLCHHPNFVAGSAAHGRRLLACWLARVTGAPPPGSPPLQAEGLAVVLGLGPAVEDEEGGSSGGGPGPALAAYLTAALASPTDDDRRGAHWLVTTLVAGGGGGSGGSCGGTCLRGAARLVEGAVVPALLAALGEATTGLASASGDDWELLGVPSGLTLADARALEVASAAVAAAASGSGSDSRPTGIAARIVVPKVKGKGGDFGAEAEDLAWETQVSTSPFSIHFLFASGAFS